MIIGLTGKYASGKSEAAHYLVKKGFSYYSFSGLMEAALVRRKLPVTRENLIVIANEARHEHGADYWATQLLVNMAKPGNYVVESIRNPVEIAALRAREDFVLLAITAPQKLRFERLLKRGRTADTMKTFAHFRTLEAKEAKSNDPAAQQIDACIAQADFVLDNTGEKKELFDKIEQLLAKLKVTA